MLNRLLLSAEGLFLCLEYGACLLIIMAALLGIGFLKRKTKREMRVETVRKSCLKAKKYAEEISDDKHNGAYTLLSSAKLSHLSGLITDAAWYAFQIVTNKKDIVFEGIAGSLDKLASDITAQSEDGYIPAREYENCVKHAVKELDLVIEKLNLLVK